MKACVRTDPKHHMQASSAPLAGLALLVVALTLFMFLNSCGTSTRTRPLKEAPVYTAVTTAAEFDPLEHRTIAVLIEDNARRRLERGLLRRIEDRVVKNCIFKGYSVGAQADREEIMDELGFQRSGWTDADVVEIGRMLNVQAMLIVSVDAYDWDESERPLLTHLYESSVSMGGRLLSVETSELLWLGSFDLSRLVPERDSLVLMGADRLTLRLPRVPHEDNGEEVAGPSRQYSPIGKGDTAAVVVQDLTRDLRRGDIEIVERAVITRLIERGVRIPARTDTDKLLDELEFQRSGFTDESIAAVGRLLNVDKLIIVSVNEVEVQRARDEYQKQFWGKLTIARRGYDVQSAISVRVLDIATAKVLRVVTREGSVRVREKEQVGKGVAEVVGEVVATQLALRMP